MAAQENHSEVVKFLLANSASQTLATEVSVSVGPLSVVFEPRKFHILQRPMETLGPNQPSELTAVVISVFIVFLL